MRLWLSFNLHILLPFPFENVLVNLMWTMGRLGLHCVGAYGRSLFIYPNSSFAPGMNTLIHDIGEQRMNGVSLAAIVMCLVPYRKRYAWLCTPALFLSGAFCAQVRFLDYRPRTS